MSTVRCNRI